MKQIHAILLMFTALFLGIILITDIQTGFAIEASQKRDQQAKEVTGPLEVTVVMERVYLDGEVSEEIKQEKILAMEDFWAEYKDWQLVYQDEDQIVFQQEINDISPLLKSNGYFGVTEDGTLSIFNGKPNETNEIIQSFFQIDVKKLESRKHSELRKGIRVNSKEKYEKVLKAYKPYSSSFKQ
ncbi:intercompartmental signaling factor BofC [Metabacillus arenae]|uniref:Intercompartmental signaling factor BofC n=1 Tax=Metabacillus arenae TaxID=2771434 RepID=A0A926NIL8_9BACI|nr:intercompartmental signaling factor BofC [Metabacillus arenae]MBD1381223.1 intercompartmental signaling factor BofC [Metabacillus arenae]